MKIGVLTFHRCINYGSYWQARCLVEGLRARGHEAELLDHWSAHANYAEWKCALQPTLPTPSPRADRPAYRAKMQNFFCAFDGLSLSPRFDLNEPSNMPRYDALVVGSDEVWNISHPWFGQKPLFYGADARADRLISYAASFGNYPADQGLDDYWVNYLRAFDSIAVRDDNSRNLIKKSLGYWPTLTLDPCLQWADLIAPDSPNIGDGSDFIAVYGHNFSPEFAAQMRRYAGAHGLPLVSIGYRNDWADAQWLDAGPDQFADFIARAPCVATDFFHGCVFALLNHKPFVCEVNGYRSTKITDLLRTVGGSRHLTNADASEAEIDALLSEPLSETIAENIARLRADSNAYLEGALGG